MEWLLSFVFIAFVGGCFTVGVGWLFNVDGARKGKK